jgi:hypothetical protein
MNLHDLSDAIQIIGKYTSLSEVYLAPTEDGFRIYTEPRKKIFRNLSPEDYEALQELGFSIGKSEIEYNPFAA